MTTTTRENDSTVDAAIIGGGAAGLMAAIFAGRTCRRAGRTARIVVLDGARSLGAKILVAGGGRCNVTHDVVDETAYAGSTRPAIRQVLRSWRVEDTIAFFEALGVRLKREETGKLFPVTDSARTVLDALLRAAHEAGVILRYPFRVERVTRPREPGDGFDITARDGARVRARHVVLATGGCSLPKSGSDGHGHVIARSLGHSITARVFPALVPLVLEAGHPLRDLAGIAVPATVEVRSSTGRRLAAFTDSLLCTHFGLSGPAALDISRYWIDAHGDDPGSRLEVNWLPTLTVEAFDAALVTSAPISTARLLRERALPERLAEALCQLAGVDPQRSVRQLTRDQRRSLARTVCALEIPVVGDRGWTYAEVTAGGVPLNDVHLATMASRVCEGLSLCGEILDVDGRIGGFNFQWAWASGVCAGRALGTVVGR